MTDSTLPPRRSHLPELDWLMLAVVGLCCLGLVMAVSVLGPVDRGGSIQAMQRQGIELLVGLIGFLVMALVPMHVVRRLALPAFACSAALCVLPRFVASPWNGAYRWIQFQGHQFQPVELARFCLVIATAHVLARAGRDLGTFRRGFLPAMAPVAVLAAALCVQPDHGNALLAIGLCACMALVAGVRIRHFLPWGSLGLLAFVLVALRHDYVARRLTDVLAVQPRSQVGQSLVAIASGGPFGRGLGDGWMKMGFVPEAENDFVFAVVAEEFGWLGAVGLLAAYLALVLALFLLAMRTRERFGRLLVVGVATWLGTQAFLHVAICAWFLPAKGLPLPLVSQGGSVTLAAALGIGLCLNVGARREPVLAADGFR